MCLGPQAREIGKLEARQRLTVVRRLCGQREISPRGVFAQSSDRTSAPISPPPTSQSPARPWSRSGERRARAFFVPGGTRTLSFVLAGMDRWKTDSGGSAWRVNIGRQSARSRPAGKIESEEIEARGLPKRKVPRGGFSRIPDQLSSQFEPSSW